MLSFLFPFRKFQLYLILEAFGFFPVFGIGIILHALRDKVHIIAAFLPYNRMTALDGNSSYRNYIIDAMYRLTPAALERGASYEVR